jgi:hypothetical protein
MCHRLMQGYYGEIDVKPITDNYELGYVSEAYKPPLPQPQSKIKFYLDTPPKTQTKNNVVKTDKNNLPKECLKILKAIGYEESTAKQMVKDFFKKDNANTLEEFFVKLNKHQSNSPN